MKPSLRNVLRMLTLASLIALPSAGFANQHENQMEKAQKQQAQPQAGDVERSAKTEGKQAGDAPDPYAQINNSWIGISGTVTEVTADRFTLDYGDGKITVEMDDGDRDADAYKLLPGDKVRVNGRIDDDFFEKTKIEAASVFVEKLGTTFYASPVDEEDFLITYTIPIIVPSSVVQGTATSVDLLESEFTINTGLRSLTVETDGMAYNPLDGEGYQKIGIGDVVSVSGTMGSDFFEGRELVANSVIKLAD